MVEPYHDWRREVKSSGFRPGGCVRPSLTGLHNRPTLCRSPQVRIGGSDRQGIEAPGLYQREGVGNWRRRGADAGSDAKGDEDGYAGLPKADAGLLLGKRSSALGSESGYGGVSPLIERRGLPAGGETLSERLVSVCLVVYDCFASGET